MKERVVGMGQVYISTDWHGNLNLAMQVLDYLKEDDTLYYLGDAIDRGPDGVKIMNKLLCDSRVVYIKGNHEDMLASYIPQIIDGDMSGLRHWCGGNGGDTTFAELQHCSDDSKMWYVRQINKMPTRVEIYNKLNQKFILTHAGLNPWFDEKDMSLMDIQKAYIWDRNHIADNDYRKWESAEFQDTFVVHGHTPVQSGRFIQHKKYSTKEPEALWYAQAIHQEQQIRFSHKLCLDLGTYNSKKVALFNIDSFEIKYFKEVDMNPTRDIKQALAEHKQRVLDWGIPEDRLLGVFLYGSQNYGIDLSDSDVDTKAIIIPSFEDVCLRRPVVKELRLANGEHCEVMDIRHFVDNLKKQNLNFVEVLFTTHYWVNDDWKGLWNLLFIDPREDIARFDPQKTVMSIKGQIIHTLKQHPENGKNIANAKRFEYFLDSYLEGEDYISCFKVPEELAAELRVLKRVKMDDGGAEAQKLIDKFESFDVSEIQINEGNKLALKNFLDEAILDMIRPSARKTYNFDF